MSATTQVRESALFANVAQPAEGPGRFRVRIISAGVGSSGVYPAETLKAAAEARVFAAGTHMYIDHPSESETYDRPERTIRDLAGRLVTDAVYVDEDGGALDVDVEVFTAWRQTIAELLETIGVSIRGSAESTDTDEQGRPIIARIIEAKSVDFVTKPGRGGKILELVESARATSRAIARGVAEATANDRREQLGELVKDAYGADGVWVWVRDFDEQTVWFEVEQSDEAGTFAQSYTVVDDVATALTGQRVEVRVQTSYVPVNAAAAIEAEAFEVALERMLTAVPLSTDTERGATVAAWINEAAEKAGLLPPNVPSRPAGQSTANESSKEDTMATIQIEESRLAQLEKDAGRATVLESERDAANQRAEEAERKLELAEARTKLRPTVAKVVGESQTLPALIQARVIDQVVESLTGDATEDSATAAATAARTAAETEAAAIAEAYGIGSPRGLGNPTNSGLELSEADVDQAVAGAFGRTVKEA